VDENEFREFFKLAYDAFPGLRELISLSPGTQKQWARMLSKVSFEDAMRVLDGWIDGTFRDPPIGWRREMFALDVRAYAQTIREARTKQHRIDEDFKEACRRKKQSALMAYPIGPIYARICAVIELRNKGGLTPDEAYDETSRLVEEGLKMLDRKVPA
jgi:hypothetical protein